MYISPQAIRQILNDPKEFALTGQNLTTHRSKRESLLIKYLFDRDEVENDFILNVNAPSNKVLTAAIRAISEELIAVSDQEEIVDPVHMETAIRRASRFHAIDEQSITAGLEKYKDYFDFCMSKRNKYVIHPSDITDVKTLTNKTFTEGIFYSLFNANLHRETAETIEVNENTFKENIFHELFSEGFPSTVKSSKYIVSFDKNDPKGTRYCGHTLVRYIKEIHLPLLCHIDTLAFNAKTNKAAIGIIKLLDKSISDPEKVIFDDQGLFLDIGLLDLAMANYLSCVSSKLKPEISYTIAVVDPKGYNAYLEITPKTLSKINNNFNKVLDLIKPAIRDSIYYTYPIYLGSARYKI